MAFLWDVEHLIEKILVVTNAILVNSAILFSVSKLLEAVVYKQALKYKRRVFNTCKNKNKI